MKRTTTNWAAFEHRPTTARSHNATHRQNDGWAKNDKEGKELADDFDAFMDKWRKEQEAKKTPASTPESK